MKHTFKRNLQKGFTLVELLIVVIILAILAAIVVPQFSSSTTDANNAAVQANLATMRSAIELYKAQHNGVYPTVAAFIAQMTAGTDAAGNAGTKYGPYIRGNGVLPTDPTNPTAFVNAVITGSPLTTGVGTAATTTLVTTTAYGYDPTSGQIISTKNPGF